MGEKKDEGYSLMKLVLASVGSAGLGFAAGYVVRDSMDPATATAAKK